MLSGAPPPLQQAREGVVSEEKVCCANSFLWHARAYDTRTQSGCVCVGTQS